LILIEAKENWYFNFLALRNGKTDQLINAKKPILLVPAFSAMYSIF